MHDRENFTHISIFDASNLNSPPADTCLVSLGACMANAHEQSTILLLLSAASSAKVLKVPRQ